VSFRGSTGTTAGYYVPQALGPRVRTGVAAWHALQVRIPAKLNTQIGPS
jgi:hypothetical protein